MVVMAGLGRGEVWAYGEVRVMKLCEDIITVFNARVDPKDGGRVWTPTVIRGASWWELILSDVDAARGGLAAANRRVVRIPNDADTGGKRYVSPGMYARTADVSELWTLAPGDLIVKGELAGDGWTPAALVSACDGCMTVLGVTDNCRAREAPHLKAVGM